MHASWPVLPSPVAMLTAAWQCASACNTILFSLLSVQRLAGPSLQRRLRGGCVGSCFCYARMRPACAPSGRQPAKQQGVLPGQGNERLKSPQLHSAILDRPPLQASTLPTAAGSRHRLFLSMSVRQTTRVPSYQYHYPPLGRSSVATP